MYQSATNPYIETERERERQREREKENIHRKVQSID